jgi:nucleoside-diphosphate-sugar epimerase
MASAPLIVITGAAGFLGRRLVEHLQDGNLVIAIDRLPRSHARIEEHPNVHWHQIDLADPGAVRETFSHIRRRGPARALIHLAAHFDFTGEPHPEYRRTNVDATRLVLESSCDLDLECFVFASSIAACDFSSPGQPINEETPPAGNHVYAVSKRLGEEMLAEFADRVPSCSVRFAALFSNWCEHPPLYFFLDTWLSERWNSRILGGRGNSAIPYLHVRDAVVFLQSVLERRSDLEPAEVLLASTDGAVSHRELFESATAHAYGIKRRAIHVPRPLCGPGMRLQDAVGRVLGRRPFERAWMARYVDRRFDIDAGRTRRRLGWEPRPGLAILNRLPSMIENATARPEEWHARNRAVLEHRGLQPADLVRRRSAK